MNRRRLLLGSAAAAALATLSAGRTVARESRAPRFARNPFTLGVASGYPLPDGVTLWTRLAPDPLAPDGGLVAGDIPVRWEVAADPAFRALVRSGTTYAEALFGHSVHLDLLGLEPDREYWYRFHAGEASSATGRTRTAPAAGTLPARLRVAVASCQDYEHGYFAAWRRIAADDTDLVVHLGDYIYETTWGVKLVRSHGSGECYTLGDYRVRHALYRTDAALSAAHAACPWLVTWDDHEVDNDYAADVALENDEPALFLARRAAAYQAFYEHMPVPRRAAPAGPWMRLHATRSYGDLLALHVLDTRQYRSPHPCPPPGRRGANRVSPAQCPQLLDPAATMLGARQEAWLANELATVRPRWNLLAQGVVVAHTNELAAPEERYWTDAWGGYPAARERLFRDIEAARVRNPVVLGGDIHAFVVSNLHQRPADPRSPIVASEFVTTSISSEGTSLALNESHLANNPATRFADPRLRGWLRLDVTPATLTADLMALDDVYDPDSAAKSHARFVLEDGQRGVQRG